MMPLYKKLTTLCYAAVLALGLVACGGGGGGSDDMAETTPTPPAPAPAPTVTPVDVAGNPDLVPGSLTLAAGATRMVGDTTVTCPTGGDSCTLTVTEESVTGILMATSTGGVATVAHNPPPPGPTAAEIAEQARLVAEAAAAQALLDAEAKKGAGEHARNLGGTLSRVSIDTDQQQCD